MDHLEVPLPICRMNNRTGAHVVETIRLHLRASLRLNVGHVVETTSYKRPVQFCNSARKELSPAWTSGKLKSSTNAHSPIFTGSGARCWPPSMASPVPD